MKKIKRYMKENNITWQQFADRCKISRQTVWLLMNSDHVPYLRTIRNIEQGTNGYITVEDWK